MRYSIDQIPEHLRDQVEEQLSEWNDAPLPSIVGEVMPTEREEQAAVIAWCDKHPVAFVIYANVNGQYRQGQRPEPGLRPGVPDLFLPVARRGYHGLYLELKRQKGGRLSVDQSRWLSLLGSRGYMVAVCKGAEEAIDSIKYYLSDVEEKGHNYPVGLSYHYGSMSGGLL